MWLVYLPLIYNKKNSELQINIPIPYGSYGFSYILHCFSTSPWVTKPPPFLEGDGCKIVNPPKKLKDRTCKVGFQPFSEIMLHSQEGLITCCKLPQFVCVSFLEIYVSQTPSLWVFPTCGALVKRLCDVTWWRASNARSLRRNSCDSNPILTFCDLNKLRIRFVVPFIVSSQASRCLKIKKNKTTVGQVKVVKHHGGFTQGKSPQYYMVL